MHQIKALFLDVGGVLLTNGWDKTARKRAADHFCLNFDEIEERHRLIYDIYELGKISLKDYLNQLVFYQEQSFSFEQFFQFMKMQSEELPLMVDYVKSLKKTYSLKVAVVSNEAKDLTLYRVEKFRLKEFVDYFIFSCFVHLRKPDPDIFLLALEVGMLKPSEVLYVDDRAMLVEEASSLGMRVVHHESAIPTINKINCFLSN